VTLGATWLVVAEASLVVPPSLLASTPPLVSRPEPSINPRLPVVDPLKLTVIMVAPNGIAWTWFAAVRIHTQIDPVVDEATWRTRAQPVFPPASVMPEIVLVFVLKLAMTSRSVPGVVATRLSPEPRTPLEAAVPTW
jgi:hypothetical protein